MPNSGNSMNMLILFAVGACLVSLAVIAVILLRWLQKRQSSGPRLNPELIPKLVITDMSMFPVSVTVVDDEEDLGKIISSNKPIASSEEQPQPTIIVGPGGVQLNIEHGLQEALNKYHRDHGKPILQISPVRSSTYQSSVMATSFSSSPTHSNVRQVDETEDYSSPESAGMEKDPAALCSLVVTLPSSCDLVSGEHDLGLMEDCQYLEHYWSLADDAASDSSHGSHNESTALILSTLETNKLDEKLGSSSSSSKLQACLRSLPSLRSVGTIDGLDARILDYIWRITNHGSVNNFNAITSRSTISISGPAIRIKDDIYTV